MAIGRNGQGSRVEDLKNLEAGLYWGSWIRWSRVPGRLFPLAHARRTCPNPCITAVEKALEMQVVLYLAERDANAITLMCSIVPTIAM